MIDRRSALLGLSVLGAGALVFGSAGAHHGWRWAEDQNSELTGVIKGVHLGNPHGEVILEVDGVEWTVEVGQPWRNDRAGLTADLLSLGRTITVSGHKSADPNERVFKAERVFIDGTLHDLYPNRD